MTTSLTFILTGLIQTVSSLAETAQILITGNSSTTNNTSEGDQVFEPVHWSAAGLLIGAFLLEISVLNYSKKILQSENIEQATKNHIHSTIQTVAMVSCCTAALRLGNVISPLQTAEFGLGILHPNFLLADLLLFFRIRKAIRDEYLGQAQARPVNDARVLDSYTIVPLLKVGMLLSSGITQVIKPSTEYCNQGGCISVNRVQLSTFFILLRMAIDFPTKQIRTADIKDVIINYFYCFLPRRRQPGAGVQQIQQNPLNQPLILNI